MTMIEDASFDGEAAVVVNESPAPLWSAVAGDVLDEETPALPAAASNTVRSRRVQEPVNRVHKHDLPKQRVAARLRRMGATVHAASASNSYDLVVNDELRVTLRVAYPGLRRHRVTVAGRSYRYRYRTWHFNFHHHGRFAERYTDFFVCIAVNPNGRDEVFIIPWEEVTGKTFSLHGGRGRYKGRYAPFRDGWQRILDSVKGNRPLRHVA